MQTRRVKGWYLVHKWSSLVCTVFMLLLCVTGLPLVFAHEIDHALGRSVEPPAVEGPTQSVGLDAIVRDAARRRPNEAVQFVSRDWEEPELWYVRLGERVDAEKASAFFTYDARTGEFLSEYPLDQGFMSVMLRLHIDMFAGLPGTLFLGVMGLLLVVALGSGAVLYGPYMRKVAFGEIRRARSARIKWLDVHNLVGIATLVWFLVVSVTGVVNTLSIPIFAQWQATELATMAARHGSTSSDWNGSPENAVAAAREAAPDMELSFMAFPGNDFATSRHFVAFMHGRTPLTSKLLTPLLIDAHDGRVVERRDLPWYVSALLVSQPLHFGNYGGLPLKILWALLDLLAIVVLGSGLYLWVKRRNVSFEHWLRSMAADDTDKDAGMR